MFSLILAVTTSALVSISMRFSETKIKNRMAMLCVNYLTCLGLAWAVSGFAPLLPGGEGQGLTLAFGGINGVLYLVGFVLLQRSIRKNGVVLSSTFMKLGLVVSILLSILCFGEMPSWLQWLGCGLALGAILLVNSRPNGEKAGNIWGLLALMCANGMADGMSKVFEELGNPALAGHFLLYTFAAALVCCLLLTVKQGEGKSGKWEWIFGILIGIPNFFSAKFLLGALTQIPAVIVYPVASVGTILTVTLAGVLFFRERLEKRQWTAMGLILAALTLLNL